MKISRIFLSGIDFPDLNAQKPGLIKDPYIYKPDLIMLDLEDAVEYAERTVRLH